VAGAWVTRRGSPNYPVGNRVVAVRSSSVIPSPFCSVVTGDRLSWNGTRLRPGLRSLLNYRAHAPCHCYASCGAASLWLLWFFSGVGLGPAYRIVLACGSGRAIRARIVSTVHLSLFPPFDEGFLDCPLRFLVTANLRPEFIAMNDYTGGYLFDAWAVLPNPVAMRKKFDSLKNGNNAFSGMTLRYSWILVALFFVKDSALVDSKPWICPDVWNLLPWFELVPLYMSYLNSDIACIELVVMDRVSQLESRNSTNLVSQLESVILTLDKLMESIMDWITSGIRAFALRNFDLEVMEFESAHSNTTAKLPILKLGEYEMWVIRIKQYFQEKSNKKNYVKARSFVIMDLPYGHLRTFVSTLMLKNGCAIEITILEAPEDSVPPEWNTSCCSLDD
ncbi:hypothetical protein Tco_1556728, partial [Tanacetum coccineum]